MEQKALPIGGAFLLRILMQRLIKATPIVLLDFFLAGLLLSSIAFIPQFTSIGYDYKRLFELIFLLITLLVGCLFRFNIPYYLNKKLQYCLVSLLVLSIASIFSSESLKYATIEFITLFALVIASILISRAWNCYKNTIRHALSILVIAFFIIEIKFYTYYLAYIFTDSRFNVHEFFPSFIHVRFFNQYQLWSLPLLPLALNNSASQGSSYRLLINFICISWWLMFFTTGGRGVIVAMLGAALLSVFFFRRLVFEYIKRTLLFAACGLMLYQLLFHAIPFLLHPDTDQLLSALEIRSTSSGRDILWLKALRLIAKYPLLGIGPMHFAWFDSSGLEETHRITHPHNSLLQLASEWGLPALLCIIYLLCYAYKQWMNKFNKDTLVNYSQTQRELIIALTYATIAATIYSLFSGVIVMPMSQLMGVFIISLMLAIYNADEKHLHSKKSNMAWIFLPLAVIYPYVLYPDIKELLSHKETIAMDPHELHPRFWLRGNIFQRDY